MADEETAEQVVSRAIRAAMELTSVLNDAERRGINIHVEVGRFPIKDQADYISVVVQPINFGPVT
jgi:hypothetical protein